MRTASQRKAKYENRAALCGRDPKQHCSPFDELFLANAAPTRIRWQEYQPHRNDDERRPWQNQERNAD
jgi:hypothetical protein